MTDPITTAREQTARVLATRELSCWEGEYSPEPEEYDDAHRRTTRAILEPSGPLAPLCAAYEAQLAEVTRERDEAREELAAIERTRIAAREILAMKWAGPTPADELLACPAELGPRESPCG